MSYFKLLSSDPADYEPDENAAEESYIQEDNVDYFDIRPSEFENYLDITLDTGEQFCVPMEWLICACRYHNFSADLCHNKFIH
jgi:hypothetical protein